MLEISAEERVEQTEKGRRTKLLLREDDRTSWITLRDAAAEAGVKQTDGRIELTALRRTELERSREATGAIVEENGLS